MKADKVKWRCSRAGQPLASGVDGQGGGVVVVGQFRGRAGIRGLSAVGRRVGQGVGRDGGEGGEGGEGRDEQEGESAHGGTSR